MSVPIALLNPAAWTGVCHECRGLGMILFQGEPELCSHPGAVMVDGKHVVPADPTVALLAAIFIDDKKVAA